ncbi:MAG: hypothetical protein OXE99_08510, partial [Cellvibrionales bacterium]|nr:hypothetical protein [Cellvibrionales bacterium]
MKDPKSAKENVLKVRYYLFIGGLISGLLTLWACSSESQRNKKQPVEQNNLVVLETFAPSSFDQPMLLLLGDAESITVVSHTLVNQQLKHMKTVQGQESLPEGTLEAGYIGDIINEKLSYAVLQEMGHSGDAILDAFDSDVEQKTYPESEKDPSEVNLEGLSPQSQKYKPFMADDAHIHVVKTRADPAVDAISELPRVNIQSLPISDQKTWRYRFWRGIHRILEFFEKRYESDKAYFLRAYLAEKLNANYLQYNQMPEITLSQRLSDQLAKKHPQHSVSFAQQFKDKGKNMTLGMLPQRGLLEDVASNNQARENFYQHMLSRGESDRTNVVLAEVDRFVNALKMMPPHRIKKIMTGDDGERIWVDVYEQIRLDIDNDTILQDMIDIKRLWGDRKFNLSIDDKLQTSRLSKELQIHIKNDDIDQLGKLRQIFRYFSDAQIEEFTTAQSARIKMDLTEEQQLIIDVNGDIDELLRSYHSLKEIDEEALNSAVIPRRVHGVSMDLSHLRVASIVEAFELDTAGIVSVKAAEIEQSKSEFSEGRYSIELSQSGLKQSLGVNGVTLVEFSSRDREMLTPHILSRAIDYVKGSMDAEKEVYIHCKSGKGRSATVATGARSDLVIEAFNQVGIKLSSKEIEAIVDEQISQIKAV